MTEYKIDLTTEQARRLIDYLDSTSGVVDKQIAAQLEQQMKSAIKEPLEFASVVKVKTGTLFVRIGAFEQYPWVSGACARAWDDLDAVEVLRVGVGDNEAAPLRCIGGMLDRPEHAKRCPACSAKADEAAYNTGVSDTVSALVARLQEKREGAWHRGCKLAYDEAIQIAEAL